MTNENEEKAPEPIWNGMFPHLCEEEGCTIMVNFDDEPKCFMHSPSSGSHVPGYSAKEKAAKAEHPAYESPRIEEITPIETVEQNIFAKEQEAPPDA